MNSIYNFENIKFELSDSLEHITLFGIPLTIWLSILAVILIVLLILTFRIFYIVKQFWDKENNKSVNLEKLNNIESNENHKNEE